MNAGAFVERAGPNTSMTSDMTGAVKGSFGFLNGFDPCKGPGRSVLSASVASRVTVWSALRAQARRIGLAKPNKDEHWQ